MTEKTLSLKFNVPIFKIDQLSANWEKVMAKNENFKLHDAVYEGLGPCSVLILYNIEKNIDAFYKISTQINIFANMNQPNLAKLFGIIVDREKFCLVFERLSSSLESRLNTKSINEKEKFVVLFEIMELILFLHESKFRLYDLRPSNIFMNEQGDVKMIFPLENIHLFRDETEEEEEIIEKLLNQDDFFLRFTAPELLAEPSVDSAVNDIWMLGCLFVEIFSKYKIWDGYSENEIIKQLKNLSIPKIPNDIPQANWGLICECLNPFYKARHDIKDVLTRFYFLIGKQGYQDIQGKLLGLPSLAGYLPVTVNNNVSQVSNMNNNNNVNNSTFIASDDPYAIRKCHTHPKNLIDMFCTQCNDLICTKCQFSTHKDHNDENIIIDIHTYVEQAGGQFDIFQEKFRKFIEISTSNFPIDDTIFEYLSKQKNVIDVLYDDQKRFINTQFDVFHQRIDSLKELEMANLSRFRDFFKGKFMDLENKINDLVDEKTEVEEFVQERVTELKDFTALDAFAKEGAVRRIPSDMNVLKNKKQTIMNLFKEYQKHIGDSDKIKRYFQRAVNNLKENKAYELIKVLEKLYNQLDSKYKSVDLQEYMNNIIVELDEYALMNSRNNALKNTKEILIACFKSKKVLSYNNQTNSLSIIEADFSNTSLDCFLNFSRSININGILYINGGWDDSKKVPLKYHLSFDPKTNKVTQEPDMLYGHSAHSLVFVPPQYIYCVSGSGIGKCEKYGINTKVWTEMPELNYHRQNSSMFYHNEQYLYVFGGLCWDEQLADFVFVETVERLDIGFGPVEESLRWEVVPTLKAKDNVVISKSVMTVVPISASKILLVGGMFKDQSYSDDVILFDFEKLEFSLLEDLKLEKQTCFPNKYFLFFGDFAYQFDNEGDIHEFNVKDLTFKVVNHHKPINI